MYINRKSNSGRRQIYFINLMSIRVCVIEGVTSIIILPIIKIEEWNFYKKIERERK